MNHVLYNSTHRYSLAQLLDETNNEETILHMICAKLRVVDFQSR